MATFKDKISNLINSQAPEFVVEQHPKFLEFIKTYYTFMESAELTVTSVQTTDGILLETETSQTNELLLDASRLDTDRTQLDAGDKIILESSTFGKFTRGETITGQTSKATTTVLAEDLVNGRLFISAQDKFIVGETILGNSSNASALVNIYKPNPVNTIQDLLNFRDPDKVISNFLTKFRNEFLNTLPETLYTSIDKRNLIKNIKSLYRTKGTDRGHALFFKLLFGLKSETIYPRENMLRVSDGKWNTKKILRALASTGDTLDLVGRTITGETSGATAIIEHVNKLQIGATEVSEFILNEDTILGTFEINETIRGTKLDTDDSFIKAAVTGIPATQIITNDGSLYNENDTVTVTGGGQGATVHVEAVGRGKITEFIIGTSGVDYEIGDDLIFTNTGTGGGSVKAKVSIVNGGFTQEDSTSLTEDHIVFEDETTRGDLYTGNKVVQESGTGVGDITDIRIINAGNNYKSLPSVVVDDTTGSGATIFAYGTDIGRVLGLKVVESGFGYEAAPTPPTVALPSYIIVTNLSGSYKVGEVVTGVDINSVAVTATVVSYTSGTGVLKVSSPTGSFAVSTTITSAGGAQATVAKNDLATSTMTIGSVVDTSGAYLSQDGQVSETAMRVQDSLYYQDFSYVIKVGRTINDWRDSFKKTMHASGFYFTGQVNIESRINARITFPITGIVSGGVQTPLFSILNTLFSSIIGRRLGTVDDGTSLRANAHLVGKPDFLSSTVSPFTSSTRDITLKRTPINITYLSRVRRVINNVNIVQGFASAGPRFSTLNKFANTAFGTSNTHSGINFKELNNILVTGTRSSLDGQNAIFLMTSNKDGQTLRTNFALPTQITHNRDVTYTGTYLTFDSGTVTMDKN